MLHQILEFFERTTKQLMCIYEQNEIKEDIAYPLFLCIGNDFSRTPNGGLRINYGNHSGEAFRESRLIPNLAALKSGQVLIIRLDKIDNPYSASFLEESFAGIVKYNQYSSRSIRKKIQFYYEDPSYKVFEDIIWKKIHDVNR